MRVIDCPRGLADSCDLDSVVAVNVCGSLRRDVLVQGLHADIEADADPFLCAVIAPDLVPEPGRKDQQKSLDGRLFHPPIQDASAWLGQRWQQHLSSVAGIKKSDVSALRPRLQVNHPLNKELGCK